MKSVISLVLMLGTIMVGVQANYINLHECIQDKCFSLYTYCWNDKDKCRRSYQLVNLCSQVNPDRVDDCINNIHNYLHKALQDCLTSNCGYNQYYQKCGITNSKIRNCIETETSDCYTTQGGQQFVQATNKCIADTYPTQCGSIPTTYTEYITRCQELNKLSCYQSNLSSASDTLKDYFACSSQIMNALFGIISILSVLIMF